MLELSIFEAGRRILSIPRLFCIPEKLWWVVVDLTVILESGGWFPGSKTVEWPVSFRWVSGR